MRKKNKPRTKIIIEQAKYCKNFERTTVEMITRMKGQIIPTKLVDSNIGKRKTEAAEIVVEVGQ